MELSMDVVSVSAHRIADITLHLWCPRRSPSVSSIFFSVMYHNVLTFLVSRDFCLYRLSLTLR